MSTHDKCIYVPQCTMYGSIKPHQTAQILFAFGQLQWQFFTRCDEDHDKNENAKGTLVPHIVITYFLVCDNITFVDDKRLILFIFFLHHL
jgi:hypothetical protein